MNAFSDAVGNKPLFRSSMGPAGHWICYLTYFTFLWDGGFCHGAVATSHLIFVLWFFSKVYTLLVVLLGALKRT